MSKQTPRQSLWISLCTNLKEGYPQTTHAQKMVPKGRQDSVVVLCVRVYVCVCVRGVCGCVWVCERCLRFSHTSPPPTSFFGQREISN